MPIELLEERKKAYIRHIATGQPPSMARRVAKVDSWREVEQWKLDDPDFSLSLERASEDGKKLNEERILELQFLARKSISEGVEDDPQLALQVLSKIDDTFNPAQKLEVEGPKHHFIGFDGKDLHEDPDGQEEEQLTQESG